ncbi:ferredoxin [Limobrevibacterium gyesilva]|uniref:Ferredoxin n=1 Tax=Limobrevibacterium gyesilva TaxID=2991712 RepID=A0AA41YT44_9PROT|nr:ferredoxin [Limobrevibacterium gyesilva]MCW3476078.1 ferredoxin family protein [Limobrevibacterium gyesilva]
MTHVITSACIDVKDGACVHACPVDCIYVGGRMLYIHPDECIDCGVCVSFCPVDAIHDDQLVPPDLKQFIAINAEFFGPSVTGWGAPGGASPQYTTTQDHPAVVAHRRG